MLEILLTTNFLYIKILRTNFLYLKIYNLYVSFLDSQ